MPLTLHFVAAYINIIRAPLDRYLANPAVKLTAIALAYYKVVYGQSGAGEDAVLRAQETVLLAYLYRDRIVRTVDCKAHVEASLHSVHTQNGER